MPLKTSQRKTRHRKRRPARPRPVKSRSAAGPSLKTVPWDAADHLNSKEEIAAYLDAVLEDGDPALLKAALGDVARSKGMSEISKAAGLSRSSLYRTLSADGNPEFVTVAKVLRALGLRLSVAA